LQQQKSFDQSKLAMEMQIVLILRFLVLKAIIYI